MNKHVPPMDDGMFAPVVTPDDYRVAARCARLRNQRAVRARRAGDAEAALKHQSYANWLIARARMWRADWSDE